MIGLPLGLAISFPISGKIADKVSWQAAFFVAGVPGLLLAVAALFIADPPRGAADQHTLVPPATGDMPFLQVVRRVLTFPTMWWIIASGALHNFNMYAFGTFIASLFKRYHSVSVEEAGRLSGLVYGFGGLGIFLGGWLGDVAFRRGVSGRLHVAWIGLAAAIPFLLLAFAVPRGHEWVCAVWLLPGCLLLYTYYGTVYTTIQDIIEPRLRGTAIAIYFFAMYLLGAALGPVATGWVSDYFAAQHAVAEGYLVITESHKALGLHDAMYLIPILDAALVVVLIAASRTVTADYLREQKRKEIAAAQEA
jgi:MFS family permease